MQYVSLLKQSGLKVTPQRLSVLRILDRHTHPTIDDIYEHPHIHVVGENCGSVEDMSYDDSELGKYQEALEKKIGNIIERLNIVASVKSCKHCR